MCCFGTYVAHNTLLDIKVTAGTIVQSDTKKREILKNPTKIEEIQEKNY